MGFDLSVSLSTVKVLVELGLNDEKAVQAEWREIIWDVYYRLLSSDETE